MSRRIQLLLALALIPAGVLSSEPHRGAVRDDNGPVAGARVRIKGTRTQTMSDAQGRFDLAGVGSRITAWKSGYFIAGAKMGDQPLTLRLRALPREDHPEYAWVDPRPNPQQAQQCGNCHRHIFDEWSASAHGNSGVNRRFLNLYDGTDWNGKQDVGWNLLKEHRAGASVCAACHAPSVPFGHPGFDDFRELDGVHQRGVHCDYCHKIADVNELPPPLNHARLGGVAGSLAVALPRGRPASRLGLEHGRFGHQLLRPRQGQLFFGPLDDVDRDEDAFSPLYSESRYCASCHEGTILGTKVYTTYSEWLQSPARKQGKQCQSCHLQPTGKMNNIAPGHGGIQRDPHSLANHRMPGGDLAMLRSCLRLHVKIWREKNQLTVSVETLATNVGHRVPTGFIDRQILLVVETLNKAGAEIVCRDGPKLPVGAGLGDFANGNYAGMAGRFFARQLEGDDGQKPVPFWRPNREVADTRLSPDQADQAHWVFPAEGLHHVRVRLLYRRFYKAIADSKGWPENDTVVVDKTLAIPVEGARQEWRGPD